MKIVIIGAGFGGLAAAKKLRYEPHQITIIDRKNYHLFQPLLYQVATAGLSHNEIAVPIRYIFRHNKNVEVLMSEVLGIDKRNNLVILTNGVVSFDYLIVAPGSRHSYFGHSSWEDYATGLKTIEDATLIQRKILSAFEKAELEKDPTKRRALLNFVIVGAGPTGAELAGAIAELSHRTLSSDFRRIDPRTARIVLVEAGPRILNSFSERLSFEAKQALISLGVEVWENSSVDEVNEDGVVIAGKLFSAQTIIWAAGVSPSPAGLWLNTNTDNVGRVLVESDLSLAAFPNIFVIGDVACVYDAEGKPLPGLAPVATQEGKYVAGVIHNRIHKKGNPHAFVYNNKGNLCSIGRSFAIADFRFIKMSGFFAWIIWIIVHIMYLINFRNRILVMTQWIWSYLTYQKGAQIITTEIRQPSRESTERINPKPVKENKWSTPWENISE